MTEQNRTECGQKHTEQNRKMNVYSPDGAVYGRAIHTGRNTRERQNLSVREETNRRNNINTRTEQNRTERLQNKTQQNRTVTEQTAHRTEQKNE